MRPERHLNEELKPTVREKRKMFIDGEQGPQRAAAVSRREEGPSSSSPRRHLGCYRAELGLSVGELYAGQSVGSLGTGSVGDVKEIAGLKFEWDPRAGRAWTRVHAGHSVHLQPACAHDDAAAWVQTFLEVERSVPSMLESPERNAEGQTVQIAHFVGVPQATILYVALTDVDESAIHWYNHPCGRLFATGICEVTKNDADPTRRVELKNFFYHEIGHVMEPQMQDWLDKLVEALPAAAESGELRAIALQIDPHYLPEALDTWRKEKEMPDADIRRLTDDLAAEFLVEAYSRLIWRRSPWTTGVWPVLDSVAEEMQTRVLRLSGLKERPPAQKIGGKLRVRRAIGHAVQDVDDGFKRS